MIGWLAYPLHLRVKLTGRETFRDLLASVSHELNEAHENQHFGDQELVSNFNTELFFNWFGHVGEEPSISAVESGNQGEVLRTERFPIPVADLIGGTFRLLVTDAPTEIIGEILYRADLFREATMERFSEHFRLFSALLSANPETLVTAVPMER